MASSMASSREASPANDSAPTSPVQLTPNSKVKALLASFDNDSDDEPASNSARAKLNSILAKNPQRSPSPAQHAATLKNNLLLQNAQKNSSAEEDDEDEDIVRPMGRMAARMQAVEDDSEPEAAKGTGDARERVKRMLMAKSKTPEPVVSDKESADDDDSDASIVPRKRKVRVSRHGTPASSPEKRSGSPGLFVSPTKSAGQASDSDEDTLPADPLKNERFKALVEKKRQERLEKEARQREEKAKEMAERAKQAAALEDDELNEDFVDQQLTQQTKPTRKAGKKAMEAMAQETQRLSRNTQLAHQAKTKRKVTTNDLFQIFKFRGAASTPEVKPEEGPTSSSPAPHSDVEMHETPPTSPASHVSNDEKLQVDLDTQTNAEDHSKVQLGQVKEVEALSAIEDSSVSSVARPLDKGKGRSIDQAFPESKAERNLLFKQRPIRVQSAIIANTEPSAQDDSDSDLEIIPTKTPDARRKRLDAIFDRIPAKQTKESNSLHALKTLAHLKSPGKQTLARNQKPSLTSSELQLSLQQKARQQAALVREEREAALRAKGIIVQTAEEREKALAEVEDLISKARREGEELRRQEKAAAKKERKDNGEVDPLGDSSDDEDWNERNDNAEVRSMSGSGSEDDGASDASGEEDDEDDEEDDEEEDELALEGDDQEETPAMKPLFDEEADEDDEDEPEPELSAEEGTAEAGIMEEDQEDEDISLNQPSRRARKSNVISDDEDENPAMETPSAPRTQSSALTKESPAAPNSVLRSATKTFIPGLTVAGPAGLGLTQIFAGTMDESQMDDFDEASTAPNSVSKPSTKQDSLSFLRGLPAPDLPPFVPTMTDDSQDVVVDSQAGPDHASETQSMETQTQGFQLGFSQSQVHGFDSLVDPAASQFSEAPEATQDVGFQHMTPIRGRFVDAPPSTVDTVVMGQESTPQTLLETPIVKKKGKLRRRAQVAAFSDDEDVAAVADEPDQEDEFEISSNVFDVMRKASKKKETVVDDFDKKTSKAKEMVHDQAEESEDDYAGLGGASDEGSDDEEDEYVKEMIDDEGGKDVDESKLAAFFADRERANDEKQVEKLYSDITKGLLRRKRGADYDLSDSDDGGEARKRMKRKEFAKMRKALLADERIGKIADNPKKEAFLRAIEDRGSEDEVDFLAEFGEPDDATDSQMSQADVSEQRVPDSQPDAPMGPPKRKRSDMTEPEPRAPPHLRRTAPSKKPSNLAEIRESLSSLIEEPNAMVAPTPDSDSDGELEIEGEPDLVSRRGEKENRDPFALRRKNVSIVDRISLKRASSSSLSNNSRLAFAASSSAPGFQVPPLLRRATTNSSIASNSSGTSSLGSTTSATERQAGGAGSDGIKRGGGKSSGVNYFARENERKAAVMKTEKRREQKLFKGAEVRRKAVGGLFGGGKFE